MCYYGCMKPNHIRIGNKVNHKLVFLSFDVCFGWISHFSVSYIILTLVACKNLWLSQHIEEILTIIQSMWVLVLILLLTRWLTFNIFLKLSWHLAYSSDICRLKESP